MVLRAEEYHQGNLDWHALQRSNDVRLAESDAPPGPARPEVEPVRDVQTFVPTQVVFDGMPNTRWWAFEDRRTNFGKVTADTTDVGKLMLMEFALVFANDWFVVPWTLPVGTLARVHGIAVTTVFDERLWVEPVAPPAGAAGWDRWSMFALADESGGDPRAELVLLPVAPKVQEGDPLEEVSLVRDEMANMVWAIEHQVPLPSGWPRAGGEAAHELRTHLQGLVGPPAGPPPDPAAPIRYQVMSTVPEQWLPFVPVHVDGSSRETQLQRAAMLRFLDGDEDPAGEGAAPDAVDVAEPAGRLLRLRGGGPACGRPDQPVLPAHPGTGRLGRRLVRRPQADRPRRGEQRPRLRPDRGLADGLIRSGPSAGRPRRPPRSRVRPPAAPAPTRAPRRARQPRRAGSGRPRRA